MRRWLLLGAIALLAAAVWCGASYAIGNKIAEQLAERKRGPARPTGVAIIQLDHHPGVFRSNGSAEMRVAVGCGAQANQLAPTFHVEYEIDHTPGLGSPVHARLKARPLRIAGYDMRALVGDEPLLYGDVVASYAGDVRASFQASAITRQTNAGSLMVAPSRGRVKVSGDKTLELSWVLPEFRALTPRSDVHFQGLELHWKLDDRRLGTGKTWFRLGRAQLGRSHAEGVGIATQAGLNANQLALTLAVSASKLDFGGLVLERVFAQLASGGLDAQHARTLLSVSRETCTDARSPEDDARWQAALRGLSDAGFSLEVQPLTAASTDGGLNGDLTLALTPRASLPGKGMLARIDARGQIKVDGASLSDRVRSQRGMRDYFIDDPSGVHASFAFQQRNMVVNDRPWKPLLFQLALTLFERTWGLGP